MDYFFGFGLTFSTFEYSDLAVSFVSPRPGPGASEDAPLATVWVTVRNTGSLAAREVVQFYVAVPNGTAALAAVGGAPIPLCALQAFVKTDAVSPGASVRVNATLLWRAALTTTALGERIFTGPAGSDYYLFASGHMPFDPKGQSNVASLRLDIATGAESG